MLINIHLSNPKPGDTTGGSGWSGARRGGGADRGWAGRDADGSVRPENNLPSRPPKISRASKKIVLNVTLRKHG